VILLRSASALSDVLRSLPGGGDLTIGDHMFHFASIVPSFRNPAQTSMREVNRTVDMIDPARVAHTSSHRIRIFPGITP
jgi:hypothetical protein